MKITYNSEQYTIPVKSEFGSIEGENVDMRDYSNFRKLALVDITASSAQKGADKYNKKMNSLQAEAAKPCPAYFLARGISEEYVKLMRGLQFLEKVSGAELLELCQKISVGELWCRSNINSYTPLEAAIAASFTEFGSDIAEKISESLVIRGAPCSLVQDSKCRGGPSSSPFHMLAARGEFARLAKLIQVGREHGRFAGDEHEKGAVEQIFGNYKGLRNNNIDDLSPMFQAVEQGHLLKFLQSPLVRELLESIDHEEALIARAALASMHLRAAALSVVAKSVSDYSEMIEAQYDAKRLRSVSFAGLPLHRACDGGSKSIPPAHAKKLVELLPDEVLLAVDDGGRTALHAAASASNVALIEALIARLPQLVSIATTPRAFENLKSERKPFESTPTPRGKIPLEIALECRKTDGTLEKMANALVKAMSTGAPECQIHFEKEQDTIDCFDTCLALCAAKNVPASGAVVDRLLKLWPNKNVLPFATIHEAVVKKRRELLKAIKSAFNVGAGTLSFDTLLVDPHSSYTSNSAELLKKSWGESEENLKRRKEEARVPRYGTPDFVTPVTAAIMNHGDVEMVKFLTSAELGCSAEASFLGDALHKGEDEKLQFESEGPRADANKDLRANREHARTIAAPLYISQVLLAAPKTVGNKPSEEDKKLLQRYGELLKFFIQSFESSNNGITLKSLGGSSGLRALLLRRFLISALPAVGGLTKIVFNSFGFDGKESSAELRRAFANAEGIFKKGNSMNQGSMTWNLARIGFSDWSDLPTRLWAHLLTETWYDYDTEGRIELPSEYEDDEDEEEEKEKKKKEPAQLDSERQTRANKTKKFLSGEVTLEGEDIDPAESSSSSAELEHLWKKSTFSYGVFRPAQTSYSKVGTGPAYTMQDEHLTYKFQVDSRVKLCNFLLDNKYFTDAESLISINPTAARLQIFDLCNNVTETVYLQSGAQKVNHKSTPFAKLLQLTEQSSSASKIASSFPIINFSTPWSPSDRVRLHPLNGIYSPAAAADFLRVFGPAYLHTQKWAKCSVCSITKFVYTQEFWNLGTAEVTSQVHKFLRAWSNCNTLPRRAIYEAVLRRNHAMLRSITQAFGTDIMNEPVDQSDEIQDKSSPQARKRAVLQEEKRRRNRRRGGASGTTLKTPISVAILNGDLETVKVLVDDCGSVPHGCWIGDQIVEQNLDIEVSRDLKIRDPIALDEEDEDDSEADDEEPEEKKKRHAKIEAENQKNLEKIKDLAPAIASWLYIAQTLVNAPRLRPETPEQEKELQRWYELLKYFVEKYSSNTSGLSLVDPVRHPFVLRQKLLNFFLRSALPYISGSVKWFVAAIGFNDYEKSPESFDRPLQLDSFGGEFLSFSRYGYLATGACSWLHNLGFQDWSDLPRQLYFTAMTVNNYVGRIDIEGICEDVDEDDEDEEEEEDEEVKKEKAEEKAKLASETRKSTVKLQKKIQEWQRAEKKKKEEEGLEDGSLMTAVFSMSGSDAYSMSHGSKQHPRAPGSYSDAKSVSSRVALCDFLLKTYFTPSFKHPFSADTAPMFVFLACNLTTNWLFQRSSRDQPVDSNSTPLMKLINLAAASPDSLCNFPFSNGIYVSYSSFSDELVHEVTGLHTLTLAKAFLRTFGPRNYSRFVGSYAHQNRIEKLKRSVRFSASEERKKQVEERIEKLKKGETTLQDHVDLGLSDTIMAFVYDAEYAKLLEDCFKPHDPLFGQTIANFCLFRSNFYEYETGQPKSYDATLETYVDSIDVERLLAEFEYSKKSKSDPDKVDHRVVLAATCNKYFKRFFPRANETSSLVEALFKDDEMIQDRRRLINVVARASNGFNELEDFLISIFDSFLSSSSSASSILPDYKFWERFDNFMTGYCQSARVGNIARAGGCFASSSSSSSVTAASASTTTKNEPQEPKFFAWLAETGLPKLSSLSKHVQGRFFLSLFRAAAGSALGGSLSSLLKARRYLENNIVSSAEELIEIVERNEIDKEAAKAAPKNEDASNDSDDDEAQEEGDAEVIYSWAGMREVARAGGFPAFHRVRLITDKLPALDSVRSVDPAQKCIIQAYISGWIERVEKGTEEVDMDILFALWKDLPQASKIALIDHALKRPNESHQRVMKKSKYTTLPAALFEIHFMKVSDCYISHDLDVAAHLLNLISQQEGENNNEFAEVLKDSDNLIDPESDMTTNGTIEKILRLGCGVGNWEAIETTVRVASILTPFKVFDSSIGWGPFIVPDSVFSFGGANNSPLDSKLFQPFAFYEKAGGSGDFEDDEEEGTEKKERPTVESCSVPSASLAHAAFFSAMNNNNTSSSASSQYLKRAKKMSAENLDQVTVSSEEVEKYLKRECLATSVDGSISSSSEFQQLGTLACVRPPTDVLHVLAGADVKRLVELGGFSQSDAENLVNNTTLIGPRSYDEKKKKRQPIEIRYELSGSSSQEDGFYGELSYNGGCQFVVKLRAGGACKKYSRVALDSKLQAVVDDEQAPKLFDDTELD